MKFLDRGYWISKHFYWQSLYHWVRNSIRFNSMTFFSAGNPAINLGGMLSDKKTEFYNILPENLLPATTVADSLEEAIDFIKKNSLKYPIILKPNTGLKGMKVEKVYSEADLADFYNNKENLDREWLVQEFLDHRMEFAILCYRFPKSEEFGISSFVEKVFPSLIADGKRTYKQLIEAYKNPFLDKSFPMKKFESLLYTIPPNGEKIVLDEIGNYSRGAKFYSLNKEIDQDMILVYKSQFQNVEGLNLFRIDCKADTLEDVKKGNYKIIEVNGMKGEPLHIYDPKSTFWGNLKTLRKHWSYIEQVTREQSGYLVNSPSFLEGVRSWRSLEDQFR